MSACRVNRSYKRDYDLALRKDSTFILRRVSYNDGDTTVCIKTISDENSWKLTVNQELNGYFYQFKNFPVKPEKSISMPEGMLYKITFWKTENLENMNIAIPAA